VVISATLVHVVACLWVCVKFIRSLILVVNFAIIIIAVVIVIVILLSLLSYKFVIFLLVS
jgi:hypothetical protein